nr:hypothetical protein [Pleurocapsa sp. FMAR1]
MIITFANRIWYHVNDSGFWLVGRFLGMDEQQTLRSWTVMETIVGCVGFFISFFI